MLGIALFPVQHWLSTLLKVPIHWRGHGTLMSVTATHTSDSQLKYYKNYHIKQIDKHKISPE